VAKRYVVEISAHAERDAFGIYEYIAKDNPRAARKWLAILRRQQQLLTRFPLRSPVIPEAARLGVEYRHLIHGEYRTVYRIEKNRVLVVRVIHGAQLLAVE
jgi:plasmid stabilization system protein ParE